MDTRRMIAAALFALIAWTTGAVAGPPDGGQTVQHRSSLGGWLGISIQDMTRELAQSMKVKTDAGALVSEVMEESPAEKAGLKEEDIIVEFDGKAIADADDLRKAVRTTAPGSTVPVTISRSNEKKILQVKIGKASRMSIAHLPPMPPLPPRVYSFGMSSLMGLKLRTLNDQLGAYFHAPGNRGVLVEEVKEESEAAKAGFLAGDVITKVGKEPVEETRDVRRALRNAEEGEKIDMEIIRRGTMQKLTLIAEEQERAHSYRFRFDRRPHDWLFEEFNGEGLDELRFELEDLAPELDGLRMELDGMRDGLKERIRGNLRLPPDIHPRGS